MLVDVSLINDIDSSTIGLRPLDIKGIDMDKNSIKRKSRESAQPIVPKRPVPVLAGPKNDGINSGMISGNNPLPSAPSPKANQRTQSALAHPGSSRKGKAKSRDEPVPRSSRRTFSVEPTATSSTPVGPFRASSKLLALQKSSQVENPEPASIPKDMTSTTQSKSVPSSPLPPAHSLPSLPTKDCPLTSQLTHQSPGTSIPDQYGFETASIFEQALSDVEQLVKEESALTNLPRTLLADQGNRDPAKRKSTSYMPPELSSHVSNVATASSLGFATTSDSRTATTTDYSDIRDKDVFKGLQIALAAACNKDLDLWITKMSGCRVRGFLADLRAFEGLGVNTLADQAVRTAEKRRQEHNQWMRGHKYGYAQDCEGGLVQEKSKDRKGKRRPVRADDRGRLGLLIAEMLGNRDSRAGETVRERALAMGWRNRSVSAGY
jgi:hypothetical protein